MSILVSDFDGTLTRYDLFDLVRKRWPFSPEDDPWEKFVAGQITHFQALAEIFARIRTSERTCWSWWIPWNWTPVLRNPLAL